MNEIISHVKNSGRGYILTTGEIKIICYADDTVIIAESEDDFQRLLHALYVKAMAYNMQISTINNNKHR